MATVVRTSVVVPVQAGTSLVVATLGKVGASGCDLRSGSWAATFGGTCFRQVASRSGDLCSRSWQRLCSGSSSGEVAPRSRYLRGRPWATDLRGACFDEVGASGSQLCSCLRSACLRRSGGDQVASCRLDTRDGFDVLGAAHTTYMPRHADYELTAPTVTPVLDEYVSATWPNVAAAASMTFCCGSISVIVPVGQVTTWLCSTPWLHATLPAHVTVTDEPDVLLTRMTGRVAVPKATTSPPAEAAVNVTPDPDEVAGVMVAIAGSSRSA